MRTAERLRYLVLAAQREGNRRLAEGLRPLGLTPSQAEVLRVLGDHAPLTLSGVGAMLVCESGTNPSRLVDRLVDAGLVERVTDSADRRQLRLALTASGREREARVRQVEDALYADLDLLGVDERMLQVLELAVAGQPSGIAYGNRVAADSAR